MSLRPRRALVGLVIAGATLAALPATALAAGETLNVAPSTTQAGSNPSITTTQTFDPADSPRTVVFSGVPGLLANLNVNASCRGTPQLSGTACLIGDGTITFKTAAPESVNLFLVPSQSPTTDGAGIEMVPTSASPPVPNQYIGVSLNPSAPGAVNLTTTYPSISGDQIASVRLTLNATLQGQPFTRLPSSCNTANNTMSVTYQGGANGSASQPFAATGCNTLLYAPTLTASITKDKSDSGAALVFGITQAAGESATKSIALKTPSGLTPNLTADAACLSGTSCKVGTATATSPLVPSAALANGTVTLGGSATSPTLTVAFAPPFAITLTGTISLTSNSVTFASVPDVPLTSLVLNVTGPSGGKAFNTDCEPANVSGTFTPQSGTAAKTVTTPIKFTGCNAKPTATGSTGGLASGHPKLKFKITHGKGSPNVASVAIGLPAGLKFSGSAFVSHKTCTTTKGKKKCTTKTTISGLGISGAKAKSAALKGGKLVITLNKAAGSVTISASGPLVSETKALQTNVRKHKTKTLKFTLKVTDAKHTATTLSLGLKAH